MPKQILSAVLAALTCALVAVAPAHADRDYWYTATADSGTPLRTDLPVYLQQEGNKATTTLTIKPTITVDKIGLGNVADKIVIGDLPEISVNAKPGFNLLSLSIPAELIAQARDVGSSQHVAFATLSLAITGTPDDQSPNPVTETPTTYLALDDGAAVGPQTLLGRSYQKGLPWRRIRYEVPTTWRPTSPWPGYGLTTQLTDRCAAVISGFATVIWTAHIPPRMTFKQRRLQPNVVDAERFIAFGGHRYARLSLTAVKGYGCDDSNTQSLRDQVESALRTARLTQR